MANFGTDNNVGDNGAGTLIKEGKASILQRGNEVFYNKAQVVNRDLTIAVLKYYIEKREEEIASGQLKLNKRHRQNKQRQPVPMAPPVEDGLRGIRVLEGLAASGLRAIRFALEVPGVGRVVAAELDENVVDALKKNIDLYSPDAKEKVRAIHTDVRLHMLQNPGVYDAVDLDPYGTPVQFLDSAVQCVSEGGLLMVTATDMAVLCGNNAATSWSKYGCYALHRPYMHEQALRIMLACIESHAVRYKRHIVPMLSLSVDFYIRVFVRVYTNANATKASPTKLAYIYQSQGCDSFYLQSVGSQRPQGSQTKYSAGTGPVVPQKCIETGSGFVVGGPIWSGPIHDAEWLIGILEAVQDERASYSAFNKIRGILTTASEELHDVPLYINLHEVCKTVRTSPLPSDTFASALINAGYRSSGTHANPLGIKTDAPWDVIWDVLRTWVRDHPGKAPEPETYSGKLLSKEITHVIRFARAPQVSKSKKGKVPRFVPNPEEHWGPKRRHERKMGRGSVGVVYSSRGQEETEMPDPETAECGESGDEAPAVVSEKEEVPSGTKRCGASRASGQDQKRSRKEEG